MNMLRNPNSCLLRPRPYPAQLSLVIPVYNEESVVPFLRGALEQFVAELGCESEIVLVNDGSTDATLQLILDWAERDTRVKVINFSRNFGHQMACTAGLDYASGDAIVLLDADLQDPFNVIHRMLERYCEGYDVVYGQRETRQGETWFKRFTAWSFYRLMQAYVHKDLPVDTGDFRLLSRSCLAALQQMRETHRFLRGMVAWVGFPQIGVRYQRSPRVAGSTKYTLSKMLRFAWTAATSFSVLPLKASMLIGVIVTMMGLAEGIHALLAKICHWYVVPGWSSLTVLISIIGGTTLMSIGVLGEYIGKLYEQSKNRPLYVVSQTVNVSPGKSTREESRIEAVKN
jgi:glycosyltransferase involved in cell wall biosynthesis